MSEVPCIVHVCAVIKRQWGGQDCGEDPWVQRLALDFRNLDVALDPLSHANSVALDELLSLPEA